MIFCIFSHRFEITFTSKIGETKSPMDEFYIIQVVELHLCYLFIYFIIIHPFDNGLKIENNCR
jgi:hypothetical protein